MLQNGLRRSSSLKIFKSFLWPLLEYGDIIYDIVYNASFLEKLSMFQYNSASTGNFVVSITLIRATFPINVSWSSSYRRRNSHHSVEQSKSQLFQKPFLLINDKRMKSMIIIFVTLIILYNIRNSAISIILLFLNQNFWNSFDQVQIAYLIVTIQNRQEKLLEYLTFYSMFTFSVDCDSVWSKVYLSKVCLKLIW